VYQDLGNTNFTFLSSTKNHNKEFNTGILTKALLPFGIKAEASGRNDILVNGLKVSGSAYKLAHPRALHHGTLMINVDLNALSKYLNPNKAKLLSKGVTSVLARVHNLQISNPQVNHDSLSNSIITEFKKAYNTECDVEQLDASQLKTISSLNAMYEQLNDWNWRYGVTPSFNHHMETRFEWGIMDVHINSTNGLIEGIKIYSDSLLPAMIDDITAALKGVKYSAEGIRAALKPTPERPFTDAEVYVNQFRDWLIANI